MSDRVELRINDIIEGMLTVGLDIVYEDPKYIPAYANDTDACMDLKAKVSFGPDKALRVVENKTMPEYSKTFEDTENSMWIMPNESRTFGTGIKVAIPKGYVMLVYPRSSTGFKLNCMLANTTGVIDAGYRNEILIKLHNYGDYPIKIEDGQRVAQFMIIPRPFINLHIVEDDENFRKGDRGGGIGSTGN